MGKPKRSDLNPMRGVGFDHYEDLHSIGYPFLTGALGDEGTRQKQGGSEAERHGNLAKEVDG
jgi:hypothetical protein